jgi:hypothetical protein
MTTVTTTTRKISLARPAPGRKASVVLSFLVALVLLAPSASQASDRTLKTALGKWSHTIALDARGISLSASMRHPRRMMLRARTFRADSLRAQRALAKQRPTTARGRRAKQLASAAFRNYAAVGTEWARSGQARIRGRNAFASRHASIAQSYARRGNRLIRSAGRLLR